MATAIAWLAVVLWGALRLRGDATPTSVEEIDPNAAWLNLMLVGVVATLPIAGLVAWRLMAPIESNWRRGGLSMVAVLGGASVAMLATFVAHLRWGPAGLVGLVVLGTAAAFWFARLAHRAAAEGSAP